MITELFFIFLYKYIHYYLFIYFYLIILSIYYIYLSDYIIDLLWSPRYFLMFIFSLYSISLLIDLILELIDDFIVGWNFEEERYANYAE